MKVKRKLLKSVVVSLMSFFIVNDAFSDCSTRTLLLSPLSMPSGVSTEVKSHHFYSIRNTSSQIQSYNICALTAVMDVKHVIQFNNGSCKVVTLNPGQSVGETMIPNVVMGLFYGNGYVAAAATTAISGGCQNASEQKFKIAVYT